MIIGLYDGDMSKYIHVPLNLELMKLSSYYKKKGDIVNLSPSFSPNMYNKFIYRKDFYDGSFPSEILNSNIEYGGRAFNANNYLPLDISIEQQKPDIYIYESFRKKFSTNKGMTKAFNTMMRAAHFRLSLDGINVWDNFYKQLDLSNNTHTLFLHDYNLNSIVNSDIIIKELMNKISKNHKHLAVKFPIQVDNDLDLFKWLKFSPSSNFFLLQYNGLMKDELLYDFIEKQAGTSIATQFDYFITSNSNSEKDFIENKLSILYKQIAFLRMKRKKVNIKYEQNFFTDKRWERLIELFQCYLNSTIKLPLERFNRVIEFDSLYRYAKSLQENPKIKTRTFCKDEARDLFQLVREKNYGCFKDFYECHTVKLVGGNFQNE